MTLRIHSYSGVLATAECVEVIADHVPQEELLEASGHEEAAQQVAEARGASKRRGSKGMRRTRKHQRPGDRE